MATLDIVALSGKTREQVAARLHELAAKVYGAADPEADHPSFAVMAMALAFAYVCRLRNIPLEDAKRIVAESWTAGVSVM